MASTKLVKKEVLVGDIDKGISIVKDPAVKEEIAGIKDDSQLLLVEFSITSKKNILSVKQVNKELLHTALKI